MEYQKLTQSQIFMELATFATVEGFATSSKCLSFHFKFDACVEQHKTYYNIFWVGKCHFNHSLPFMGNKKSRKLLSNGLEFFFRCTEI